MSSISESVRVVLEPERRLHLRKVSALLIELTNKKRKNVSMVDYYLLKVDVAEELQRLRHAISDEALKIEILNGLPEQYELFRPALMDSSVSDLGSRLIALETLFNPVDGGNQDGGFSSSDGSDGVLSPIPRRRRRPDVQDIRGDIFTIMTLVLGLVFNASAKPSDDIFQPFGENEECFCQGSGPSRTCGCLPYLFILWQSILTFGFSIALFMLCKMMKTYRPFVWMWLAMFTVMLAYAYNAVAVTPYEYRPLVIMIITGIFGVTFCSMYITSRRGGRCILLFLKDASCFIYMKFKLVCQFLGVRIIIVCQTTVGQLRQGCKTVVKAVKEGFKKPPPDGYAPV